MNLTYARSLPRSPGPVFPLTSLASHSCQEYVVCQKGNYGPLVLSEFAGSAQSLGGAVLVNPWDTRGVASTIAEVFNMSETEKYAIYAIPHRSFFAY